MSTEPEFRCLKLAIDGAICTVMIDNPPLNLLDAVLIDDFDQLGRWLEGQHQLKVVVFKSANEDFFIAHADLNLLANMPVNIGQKPSIPSGHQLIVDRFRTLPQVTIAVIEGVARGGGSEFALALDMRFGLSGRAVLSQPEVGLGFPPGCGATQRLPSLVGRGNAFEVLLGCADYSALDAARIGWINRALPQEELTPFVERLVARIASFPLEAIAAVKSVLNTAGLSLHDGLCEESQAFQIAYASDEAQRRVTHALRSGLQTRDVEIGQLDDWLHKLSSPA